MSNSINIGLFYLKRKYTLKGLRYGGALKVLVILLFSVCLFSISLAQEDKTEFSVKQVITSKSIVIATSENSAANFEIGKTFLVTLPDDQQCSLTLQEIKDNMLILNGSSCPRLGEVKKNSPLEMSLFEGNLNAQPPVTSDTPINSPPVQVPAQNSTPELSTKNMAVSVHYSLADEIRFNNVYVTTNTNSGYIDAKFKGDTAFGIGLSWSNILSRHLGYFINGFYEGKREIKTVVLSGPGGAYTGTMSGSAPKFSTLVAEFGLAYRWNTFYLPIGINLAVPLLEYSSNTSHVSVESRFGVLIGGGFFMGENSSIEIFVRSISLGMVETATGTKIDYGTGYLSGLGLGYKFWF